MLLFAHPQAWDEGSSQVWSSCSGLTQAMGRTTGSQTSPESLWQGKHVPLCRKEGLGGHQGKGTPATPLLGTEGSSHVLHCIELKWIHLVQHTSGASSKGPLQGG